MSANKIEDSSAAETVLQPAEEATEAGNYFVANYPPFSFWSPDHVPEGDMADVPFILRSFLMVPPHKSGDGSLLERNRQRPPIGLSFLAELILSSVMRGLVLTRR